MDSQAINQVTSNEIDGLNERLSHPALNGNAQALHNDELLESSSKLSNSFMTYQYTNVSQSQSRNSNFISTSNVYSAANVRFSHCTSSNFPCFPSPAKMNNGNYHFGPNSGHTLQPRANPVGRRTRHFVPNEHKDEYYWQKRRKNNEAARKSREKRKTIDSVLEEKVLILSHENRLLRNELYELKVKYGEIEGEKKDDIKDSDFEEATGVEVSSPKVHQSNCLDQVCEQPCSCKSKPSVSSPTPTSHTTFTLPKVNVILESGKTTTDSASSARLVLSNLASGTLILSPINIFSNGNAIDGGKASECISSQLSLFDSIGKNDEMKEMQAANTLANLLRSREDQIEDSNGISLQEHQLLCDDISSSNGHQPFGKDMQKNKNLPCKLRFKTSKVDQII